MLQRLDIAGRRIKPLTYSNSCCHILLYALVSVTYESREFRSFISFGDMLFKLYGINTEMCPYGIALPNPSLSSASKPIGVSFQ